MKIGILLCANLSRAQYLEKYLYYLDQFGCEYDVIYWNRILENEEIVCSGNYISYNSYLDSYKSFYKKIIKYLKFAYFVNKEINKNKYDKLIILTTPMAICVLFKCLGKFKKKYLFDFRDLTKEYLSIYKYLVNLIAEYSNLFIVSSLGYLSYFHKQIKAQVCHNTLPNVHFKKNFKVNMEFPIRISYWGAIRQINYNKKVCDMFGNDSRFCFNFYGDGCYKELREYCKTQNYNNIYFGGKYKISDIGSFAQKTDILFNAYDRDFVTMLSLSVKMYDSLEYMLPMLITKDTYMADFLGEMDYVCLINVKKEYKETILKWYKKLNKEKIRRDFEKFMEIVKNDEDEFVNKLKQFCEE